MNGSLRTVFGVENADQRSILVGATGGLLPRSKGVLNFDFVAGMRGSLLTPTSGQMQHRMAPKFIFGVELTSDRFSTEISPKWILRRDRFSAKV